MEERRKKLGRPTQDPKTERIEIRLTKSEAQDLQYCADRLNMNKTDVINAGIKKIKAEIDNNMTV